MKSIRNQFLKMTSLVPPEMKREIDASFAISDRIDGLMRKRGLTKKQFADQIGRRPSEITRWLSGEHNFTIATLAMISEFFGEPIIQVVK
ncbi:MAG TPA: XRE family transcriptional regulator [Porphyromonadaceae bacterium]|nr:XRE family transcriptional regulator [Porphyromonadaceae bacterium]